MKTQKGLVVLATLALLGLSVSCSDRYQEGFNAGKDQGYRTGYDNGYGDGYLDGDEAGFERAKQYFASAGYNEGFADGRASGLAEGYNNGFAAGKTEGYNTGFNAGKTQGYNLGYDNGYDDGLADGYDMGYDDGLLDGYDMGYDDGFADGYDLGYDDGWYDGYYGFAVGKTAQLKGFANLLSMAHNDLIDYSKIQAPKSTARGVVANGKLLFEETSLTSKDTLKRAAVIEDYLVLEMSKQVMNLGLSADRSLKIAKAANHFRKAASRNALTNEDTAAYIQEISGSNLSSIQAAQEAGDMSKILEAAAAKNGTTASKMGEILLKNFL